MERLVCKYSYGESYDIISDVINILEPFTYESKQKAIDDFCEKMLIIEKEVVQYNKEYEKWQRQIDSIQKDKPKWMEVYKQRPKDVNKEFNLGTLILNYHNHISSNGNMEEPEFLTLDEWYKGK
jgi:hypothetical protein